MAARHPRYDNTNRQKDEPEELLVFGYSCKLFRDDEKALYIDQGKHLIPWMGDETLKIDRYDVRGTVADLKPLEPLPGGATEAQWSSLSDSERKAEQLCDEERYRALYHNEAEEALYQEEELKRLHQALDSQHSYGQVAYNYDDVNNSENHSEDQNASSADVEEEDQPFVAPPELDIPIGMVLPERCKLNAIIEKTALFISTQGPQMEIILKTKQANNPQFEFLSFDCPLHAYYRHLLMAIKTGRYRPREPQQEQQESDADDHYLHPSLAPPPARVELAPSIPSINYKPSADCAYSLLVSKIKDKQLKNAETSSDPSSPQPSAAFGSSSRRRKTGYGSSGSSSRSNSRSGTSDSSSDSSSDSGNSATSATAAFIMPPHEIQLIIDKMASYVIKNGRDFEAVVRSKGDVRFGFLDATHEYHPYYEHKMRVYQGLEPVTSTGPSSGPDRSKKKKKKKEKPKLVLLPQYQSSSSDSENDSPKKDNVKRKASKVQTPVCFSIKKPKEAEILQEIRSALPLDLEESSEEDDENKDKKDEKREKESCDGKAGNKDEKDRSRSRTEAAEEVNSEKEREEELRKTQRLLREKERELREKEAAKKRSEDIFQIPEPEKKEKPKHLSEQLTEMMNSVTEEKKSSTDIDDDLITEAEIIDLTDDKVVVSKAKESELQLERKRRAAAFLNRIKKDRQARSNGSLKEESQVDTSVPSPPSPPRLTELNGSVVPKHSLLARLAASNVVSKQPSSISIERKHKHKKSDITRKRSRSRSSSSGRQGKHDKKHKKKRQHDSAEYDRSRPDSRSRSRSILSPVKVRHRRQREHISDHRLNSHYDYDREDGSYSRHKRYKHKSHKHMKHRRDHRSVENDGDAEIPSQKHKHRESKNERSSESSGE